MIAGIRSRHELSHAQLSDSTTVQTASRDKFLLEKGRICRTTTCRMRREKKRTQKGEDSRVDFLSIFVSKSQPWGCSSSQKKGMNEMKHHKSYWSRTKGHRHIFLIYHHVKHQTFFIQPDVIFLSNPIHHSSDLRAFCCLEGGQGSGIVMDEHWGGMMAVGEGL